MEDYQRTSIEKFLGILALEKTIKLRARASKDEMQQTIYENHHEMSKRKTKSRDLVFGSTLKD